MAGFRPGCTSTYDGLAIAANFQCAKLINVVAAFSKLKRGEAPVQPVGCAPSRAAVQHMLQTDAKNRTVFEPST
jgi:hypothetical protein